ncbi:Regulator of G-protein signaling 2 [Triplophysa tibetana]|uniref:Regulator of G-protein signaling 2 n=1 Tax=Triplophysa tibetana TaxID=1572043 RepID=A0A5A9NVE2_9TELE|nr:Regulator of G-protein signaling 2 [Triplophysa tibetana]
MLDLLDTDTHTPATMIAATIDTSMEGLIYSKNLEPDMEKDNMKRTWRSRMLFKSFLLRKASRGTARRNPYRPTAEELSQWAESLDNLLNSKCGLIAFRLFMESEYCVENVEFWVACEEFRKINSRSKLRSKAKRIYEEFIREDSPKEVNLDFHMKETVDKCLLVPTQNSFQAAQNKVYFLMEHNSYPRFLESELYSNLCKTTEGE